MNNHKKTSKGFKLLLIIFLILALFFVKEENQQKVIDIFNNFNSNEKVLQYNRIYEVEEDESLYYYNGSIAKWNENSISFLDKDGSNIWTKEFNFMFPNVISRDKNIYIMDKYSGDIYSLDNKGNTVSRSQINAPIFNLIEDNNLVLVHIKDEDLEKLNIVDRDGNIIVEKETKNILTYSASENGSKYLISSIHISNGELDSKLDYYTINNDEIYSVIIPNEIILFTQIVGNKIIALTDTSLNMIENNEITWSIDYPLIKDIYINKDEILLLYGDNIESINLKGESINKITFGVEYNKIVPMGKYITLYGDKNILILDNEEELIKLKTDKDIIDIKGDNNIMAIHYIDGIEIYDIVDKD